MEVVINGELSHILITYTYEISLLSYTNMVNNSERLQISDNKCAGRSINEVQQVGTGHSFVHVIILGQG